MPDIRARYPQSRPIVSTTKHRREAMPDSLILSIASTMTLRAVSAPMDSSEPGRLLSIEAGMHTVGMRKAG